MEYGAFFDNGKGYRINTIKTPNPWKNILFNDAYFMEVSQRLAGGVHLLKITTEPPL